jgi:exoribonuclease II
MYAPMKIGSVVEYIDRQKIVCAVVLEVRNQRLHLYNENCREVTLSESRLFHASKTCLDMSMGRVGLAHELKEIARRRKELSDGVVVKDLWEVLHSEQEWIDIATMTGLCFPDNPLCDHESAVVRAFFNKREYFKFNQNGFFPNPEEQVLRRVAREKEAARREEIIKACGQWLRSVDLEKPVTPKDLEVDACKIAMPILKSLYIHGKDSSDYATGRAMLAKADMEASSLFSILVRYGAVDENENIDLYRLRTPVEFSREEIEWAKGIFQHPPDFSDKGLRRDLTGLPIMTIDGQSTLDFDDALSIEPAGTNYRLGIHIADVSHFVKRGDPIDRAALERGSSIYMPDQKIPMLPTDLAESNCSLMPGEVRPAISTLVEISPYFEVLDFEIIATLIRVKDRFTYHQVNMMNEDNREVSLLRNIAANFRRHRIASGAVHISVPEVNYWFTEAGEFQVSRVNRESPGRMLVSELMIMANWLMARFLADRDISAIFRTQPGPKERLYNGDEGTMFQNYMQRRRLSRFVLSPSAGRHSGLGLDAYVTATSPIRKQFDLVTQRQIRAGLGLEASYTAAEIETIIQSLEQPMSRVQQLQRGRNRYWLLKYLEGRTGQKEEAVVLFKKRNSYQILIPEYMIECELPISSGITLKPEDLIRITIQHVNARTDILSVFMG